MHPSSFRSDRGLTRLESNILATVVILALIVGAAILTRAFTASVYKEATAPGTAVTTVDAPVSVSVPAAGTVAQPPGSSKATGKDACPDLRGVQPAGFDCSLPLFVPALDLSAVREKAPYQCADPENYRLVKGQTVQREKKCVLKTAKAGRP